MNKPEISDPIGEWIALAGVVPIRAPRSGAEAVLFTTAAPTARQTLRAALGDLEALHEHFQRLHGRVFDLASEIIAQLDAIDGDADLEPTLGATEIGEPPWSRFRAGGSVLGLGDAMAGAAGPRGSQQPLDVSRWRDGDADEREVGEDGEPSLGSLGCTDQRRWSTGGTFDAEREHDGREPDHDEA
jgi:hypothetical protein